MTEPLTVAACVFDAYGTLFDVHSAVNRCAGHLDPSLRTRLSTLWRQKQLEYTWLRSLMQRHADFAQVTADGLDVAMAACELADPALRTALLDAYRTLDAFPEVPAVLDALVARGITTAILSNGTPSMLSDAIAHSRLEGRLAHVWSVETLAVYKPDPRVYALASDGLGLPPERIAFFSSNAWDAAGAASFGFRVVWVNRYAQVAERLPGTPEVTLESLAPVPALIAET